MKNPYGPGHRGIDLAHTEKDQRNPDETPRVPPMGYYGLSDREMPPEHPDDTAAANQRKYQRKLSKERIKRILNDLGNK